MKPPSIFLAILALTVISASVSVLRARAKVGEALNTAAAFAQLKTGDQIVYHCRECDSTRTITVESQEAALAHSRPGAEINCPGCNDRMRAELRDPTSPDSEIRYVNAKGHECLFIAKALPKT